MGLTDTLSTVGVVSVSFDFYIALGCVIASFLVFLSININSTENEKSKNPTNIFLLSTGSIFLLSALWSYFFKRILSQNKDAAAFYGGYKVIDTVF